MISTRDLSGLPIIDTLKRLMQSVALLDAVLCPEWEYRLHSFNIKWAKSEQMGSMRDGQGDDLFALFDKHGCFLKGFAHEAEMTPYKRDPKCVWPGVLDDVPDEFDRGLNETAFSMADTTFCIWRKYGDDHWHRGNIKFPARQKDPDGSAVLLAVYDGNPETYQALATDHYLEGDKEGRNLTLDHVRHVYAHKPLTTNMVKEINPTLTLAKLAADITEIGYPRGKK